MTAPRTRTTQAPSPQPASGAAAAAIYRDVPIIAISCDTQQIRTEQLDDDIAELALDIQAHGLLQPVGVRENTPGNYELLWGRRRLDAHKRIGRTSIPAKVYPPSTASVRAIATRENIHRRALSLREQCDCVAWMYNEEHRSVNDIAALLSRSRDWVQRRLLLPTLDPELSDAVLSERISIAHAELIAAVTDPADRAQLTAHAHQERWTLAQLRTAIASLVPAEQLRPAINAGLAAIGEPPPPTTLSATCAACGALKPVADLQLIRVCRATCNARTE